MMSSEDVRNRLIEACYNAGSQNAWAKAHGVSQAYVNDTIKGRREPGMAILRALGLERATVYDRPEVIRRLTAKHR